MSDSTLNEYLRSSMGQGLMDPTDRARKQRELDPWKKIPVDDYLANPTTALKADPPKKGSQTSKLQSVTTGQWILIALGAGTLFLAAMHLLRSKK